MCMCPLVFLPCLMKRLHRKCLDKIERVLGKIDKLYGSRQRRTLKKKIHVFSSGPQVEDRQLNFLLNL